MSTNSTVDVQPSTPALSDHLPKASDRIAAEAIGDPQPQGTPELIPAHRLRVRQRSAFLLLASKGQAIFGAPEDVTEASAEIVKAEESGGTPITPELLDYISEIDEAMENVAVDPDAYAHWATGSEAEQNVTSLFEWYVGRLGESQRSAN